ncbi:AraC family transcriptional regulator [Microbacterium sp.]|uniref:AraC family transcriptional regulator n=1 Tax=Microbacterium sp. TaxID=51671 RepID=UPI0033416B58
MSIGQQNLLVPPVSGSAACQERVVARLFGKARRQTPLDGLTGVGIGDFDVFRLAVSEPVITPTPDPAQGGHLMLAHATHGGLEVVQTGRDALTVEGTDSILAVIASEVSFHVRAGSSLIAVVLPYTAIADFTSVVPVVARRLLSDHVLNSPMWSFLDALIDTPPPWQQLSGYFIESLVAEMITSVVVSGASADAPASSAGLTASRQLVRRARGHIYAYARDARLTIQDVAASVGVPLRSLQRAFAEDGLTLADEIRKARAMAAVALLRSAESSLMMLDDVAKLTGYPDAVAMRRTFRSLGLEQPSRYRAQSH